MFFLLVFFCHESFWKDKTQHCTSSSGLYIDLFQYIFLRWREAKLFILKYLDVALYRPLPLQNHGSPFLLTLRSNLCPLYLCKKAWSYLLTSSSHHCQVWNFSTRFINFTDPQWLPGSTLTMLSVKDCTTPQNSIQLNCEWPFSLGIIVYSNILKITTQHL